MRSDIREQDPRPDRADLFTFNNGTYALWKERMTLLWPAFVDTGDHSIMLRILGKPLSCDTHSLSALSKLSVG